jgi:hypothetical protein
MCLSFAFKANDFIAETLLTCMRIKIHDDGSDGAGVEGRRSPAVNKKVPADTAEDERSGKKAYGGSLKVIEGEGLPGEADRH